MNNRVGNFEKLAFNYVPKSLKEGEDRGPLAREEILSTAKMLQVEGYPSRNSII